MKAVLKVFTTTLLFLISVFGWAQSVENEFLSITFPVVNKEFSILVADSGRQQCLQTCQAIYGHCEITCIGLSNQNSCKNDCRFKYDACRSSC